MNINTFELSFKNDIPLNSICQVMSVAMPDIQKIVSLAEYWRLSEEAQLFALAIEIWNQPFGYKTLITAYCQKEIQGEYLGQIAKTMAVLLDSDVGIGDYIHDIEEATGRFLVYHPIGTRSFAFEEYLNGNFNLVEFNG